jgi:hypothetical protein
MNRFLVFAFSIALLTACVSACNKDAGNTASPAASAKAAEAKPAAVGDLVVAHWAGNTWSEGKVDKIQGSSATIAWSDNSSPNEVDLVDTYQLPKAGAQATARTGDYVLAKRSTGTNWEGAQVTMVSPGVVTVKYVSDLDEANLAPEKVIGATPAAAADMRTLAARTDFLKKAQARTPQAPAGYKPKVGEHVLGPWTTTSWYGGRVKSISGDKALIEWEGVTPDEAELGKLVPYPTADNTPAPAVGDYVIVKPSGGSWDFAQVTAVNGSDIDVKDADGKARRSRPGEFVVLK